MRFHRFITRDQLLATGLVSIEALDAAIANSLVRVVIEEGPPLKEWLDGREIFEYFGLENFSVNV